MREARLYEARAALAVEALRYAVPESCFALKGGTAINLFVQDMPRLSVDIDLAYLPVADRATSLRQLDGAMRRIAAAIKASPRPLKVWERVPKQDGPVTRLFVTDLSKVRIKIEVSPVMRGCAYRPEETWSMPRADKAYGPLRARVLQAAELYASKFVAALDRQHPRDLFDVHCLFRKGSALDERLREAFVVYLISHNRPMHELLSPNRKDLAKESMHEVSLMTRIPWSPADLLQAREDLIAGIVGGMPERHRRFLLSFEKGKPDWQLLNVEHASALPAVRWRMQNLDTLDAARRSELVAGLERALEQNRPEIGDPASGPFEIPDPFAPPSPWDM